MMEIKVLGPGCPRCEALEKWVRNVLAELNVAAAVEKVTDIKTITAYHVLATPGLVLKCKLKSSGRIPSVDEIKTWIQEVL